MAAAEPLPDDGKQKKRMLKASKIFFLLTILYSLWIAVVILGMYYLGLGPNWALLTTEQWILSAIFLLSIAIGLEIILLLQYTLSHRKRLEPEEPKKHKEYIQGKQVHNYTIPINAKGGIFSKTYILIDEDKVLNLRYQMIPPNELWGQKQ